MSQPDLPRGFLFSVLEQPFSRLVLSQDPMSHAGYKETAGFVVLNWSGLLYFRFGLQK